MSRQQILLIGALLIVLVIYMQQPQPALASVADDGSGIDINDAQGNTYGSDAQSYVSSSYVSNLFSGAYGGNYDMSGTEQGISLQDQPGSDQDILARTIYGEAGNGGAALMQGVASVVMNRYRAGYPPGTVAGICQYASPGSVYHQFSCWNSGNKNLPAMESVTASNAVFQQCLQIAGEAISGELADNTGGAVNYYADYINPPSWVNSMRETTQIGNTIFFAQGVA